MEFVNAVSAGGSVSFFASGINFSIFTHFSVFLSLKLLKLGEIDGVKFLSMKIRRCKILDKSHVWDCVGNSLLQICKLRFGHKA